MLARLRLLKPLHLSSSASWCQSTSSHSFETGSPFLSAPLACIRLLAIHRLFPFCFPISVLNLSTGAAEPVGHSESVLAVDGNPKSLLEKANVTTAQANGIQTVEVKDKATQQFISEEDIPQKSEAEVRWKKNSDSSTNTVASSRSLLSVVSHENSYKRCVGKEQTPHEYQHVVASISESNNGSTRSSIVHDDQGSYLDTLAPRILQESTNETKTKMLTCDTVSEASKEPGPESIKNQKQHLGKNVMSVLLESADAPGCREEHVQIENWKLSHRERAEKVLVDKGFITESRIPAYQDSSTKVHIEQVTKHETARLDGKENTDEQRSDHKHIEPDLKAKAQANSLLIAALDETCSQEGAISIEKQRSLEVGIVGAPNSGKSTLINRLIGTKISAVSRKTNTTRNEILGVLTEANTQLLFYDTPGLMLDWRGQALRQDMKNRVQSAWMTADHCELLVVLVDADRHIRKPDRRVQRLVEKLGVEERVSQRRILCLNKVDLVKEKKSLLPLAQKFGELRGFERIFMISGLKGGGVKDVKEFLLDQAVLRPWEEEVEAVTDMSPTFLAMEIVWEHVLNYLHQELPYELKHEHVSWKVLKDGSVRIEQRLLVPTESHKKIVVGKHGENIRKIGMAAHAELNERLGMKVHLFLDVKLLSQQMFMPRYENEVDEVMEM